MHLLTVMAWMDAVEFNGILMTESRSAYFEFMQYQIFFICYNNAISASPPPAGVLGGRKEEDNRGQIVLN